MSAAEDQVQLSTRLPEGNRHLFSPGRGIFITWFPSRSGYLRTTATVYDTANVKSIEQSDRLWKLHGLHRLDFTRLQYL